MSFIKNSIFGTFRDPCHSDYQVLYTAHQEVVEERCELEEAENDSRLRAQKSVAVVVLSLIHISEPTRPY